MDFKRARNDEQISNRQNEIIDACHSLFSNGMYDDITFGKISEMTSISRPSIYNYYITREEILLDVLEKEYFKWFENFKNSIDENSRLNKKDLCNLLINSFDGFETFLKLLSIQYSILEKKCSFEKLTQFKMNTQIIFNFLDIVIGKTFSRSTPEKRSSFIFMMFSAIGNFYELCTPNDTEIKALKIANRDYKLPNFKEFYSKYIEILIENL